MSSLRLIDLLRKSPAPAGLFYMCSRAVLVTVGSAVVGGAISMESLGAGARRTSPAAIRAAQRFLSGLNELVGMTPPALSVRSPPGRGEGEAGRGRRRAPAPRCGAPRLRRAR